jgi:hypothetical protein
VLTVVKPDTLVRWHRKGFQLFWRWKSRPRGRPRVPADLRRLIDDMATANRTWGEERIASGIAVEARDSCVPSDGEALHAHRCSASRSHTVADVEHVRAQSRQRRLGVRFLRGDHGLVPRRLRLRGVGSRHSTDSALECDRTSHRRLDGAAVPSGDLRRRAASIPDPRSRQYLLRPCRPPPANINRDEADGVLANDTLAHNRSRRTRLASGPPPESKNGAARQDAASCHTGFGGHSFGRKRRARNDIVTSQNGVDLVRCQQLLGSTDAMTGRSWSPPLPARPAWHSHLDSASHRRMISSHLRRLLASRAVLIKSTGRHLHFYARRSTPHERQTTARPDSCSAP